MRSRSMDATGLRRAALVLSKTGSQRLITKNSALKTQDSRLKTHDYSMKYVKIEGSKKLSSFIEPMKAQLSDLKAFDSTDWLFEIKWDGYRAIAEIGGKTNKLYSRNGLTFDKAYPKVFEALAKIKKPMII